MTVRGKIATFLHIGGLAAWTIVASRHSHDLGNPTIIAILAMCCAVATAHGGKEHLGTRCGSGLMVMLTVAVGFFLLGLIAGGWGAPTIWVFGFSYGLPAGSLIGVLLAQIPPRIPARISNEPRSVKELTQASANKWHALLRHLAIDAAVAAVVGCLFLFGDQKKAFVDAAKAGRSDICLSLAMRHPSMADTSFQGTPLIHWAARCNSGGLVRLMVRQGSDVNAKDSHRRTPLHWACMPSEFEGARHMLAGRAKIPDKMTPLLKQGNVEVVTALLESGADIDAQDSHGRTPLHWTAIVGADHLALALLGGGLDPCIRDREGMTPIMTAAKHGRKEIVELLLASGVDANGLEPGRETPLHWAATREVAELLVENGASIASAIEMDGRTPLHFAVWLNHQEVARFLIEKGADTQALDRNGKKPIHYDHSGHLKGTDLGRMLQ